MNLKVINYSFDIIIKIWLSFYSFYFYFKNFQLLDKRKYSEQTPGNPNVKVSIRGIIEDKNYVELNCSLENDNGYPAKSFSWIRYPNLPQSAQKDQNRLSITSFDNQLDNGLYTCGVWTDNKEYERNHLVASTDYLLGSNPYFRLTRNLDEDAIYVVCRPGIFLNFVLIYKKNILKKII